MNKRIRKKKRLGEFYEPFLIVKSHFNRTLTDKEVDYFIDSVIDFCDSNRIHFGCGVTCYTSFEYMFDNLKHYKDRFTPEKRIKLLWFLNNFEFIDVIEYVNYIENEKQELEYFNSCN